MRFLVSLRERRELVKAWLAISLAFGILLTRYSGLLAGLDIGFGTTLLAAFGIAGFTVGAGFLLHELAHKWVAQRHGCHAEFRADDRMLLVALLTSFFGFILAAPGAVHISGHPSLATRGRVALAGPAMNGALAVLFLVLAYWLPGAFGTIAGYGAAINAWLALFNLFPFGIFDGAKIFSWDRRAYALAVVLALGLTFLSWPLSLA